MAIHDERDRAIIDAWRDLVTANEMMEAARRKDVMMPRTQTITPFSALVSRAEDRLLAAIGLLEAG